MSNSNLTRRQFSAFALAAGLPFAAGAQAFPTKPIRIVNPFAAGASTDSLARTVATGMTKDLGQPVVVESKAGAGGSIAAMEVKRAAPDGYNILLTSAGILTMNQSIYKSLPYDPFKDFAPLTVAVRLPILIVVHPSRSYRTVGELIAHAKANPGKVTYGSAGLGTSQHLAGALFESMANVKLLHVPYKGGAPAMTDLIGGQVDLMFVQVPSALPQLAGNKIRAIAVGSPRRAPSLPDVPTVAESGVPGYDSDTWYGFVTHAGVPAPIVNRLHRSIVISLKEHSAQLTREGYEVEAGSIQEMGKIIRSDADKWAKIIKAANIQAE